MIEKAAHAALKDEYAAAYGEWIASGEAEAWDSTTGDGLGQEED
jgi:hypothetical protein